MFNRPLYTTIDVGTNKVCTIIGRQTKDGEGEVLGVGVAPTQGVTQDTVVNIGGLAEALAASVRQASKAARTAPSPAFLGITGPHLENVACTGSLSKDETDRALLPLDLENALVAARPPHLPLGQELLHLVAREYLLDGMRGLNNPVGRHALKLDGNAVAVLGGSARVENLMKSAARAGISVRGLVFQGLAVGEAVLTPEERDMGALVVDIGAGTTYMAYYWRGVFWESHIIPLGGHNFTNDIAVVLGAPPKGAEEAKRTWGTAQPWKVSPTETIRIAGFDGVSHQEVARKSLCAIIHDRAVELLDLVQEKARELPLGRLPVAGVVLTGGTASLPGLREVAQDVLGGSVRIGAPVSLRGGEALAGPAFASSVGTFLWSLRYGAPQQDSQNGRSGVAASQPAALHPLRPGR
jgi:cell division protein FtsA